MFSYDRPSEGLTGDRTQPLRGSADTPRMGYLFTSRRRYVSPFALLEAIAPFIRDLAELFDGIGVSTGDDRWTEGAERIRKMREALLELSELQQTLVKRAREDALVRATLEAMSDNPELLAAIRQLPLKPVARVVLRDPPVLRAAKQRRRRPR